MRSAIAIAVTLAGCAESAPASVEPPPHSVIAGVTSDAPLAATLTFLESVLEAPPGKVLSRTTHAPGEGITTPLELPFPALADGTRVLVKIYAHDATRVALIRTAATEVVDERALLLRIRLNDECVPDGEHDRVCEWGTCIAGYCEDPFVHPSHLEEYRTDWPVPHTDPCIFEVNGEPTVEIGAPDAPFAPLAEGATMVPEFGPQGASHVFFSVRMQNLEREDALTLVTADSSDGTVQKLPLLYEEDAGACQAFGARFVLPQNGAFNQTMRLGITVLDAAGSACHTHTDVFVAEPTN
jgi:hypothetical protein